MKTFTAQDFHRLNTDRSDQKGENGRVTIIGGSSLFHGAPILSLITASRIADMVFFASPEESLGEVATQMKAKLGSFIWVPWRDAGDYIAKSDAVLIGPGFMRRPREKENGDGNRIYRMTKTITEKLLKSFPHKQWVVDGGALQVMQSKFIPPGSILTPNRKEFERLFGSIGKADYSRLVQTIARGYRCVIAGKGPTEMVVTNGDISYTIETHGKLLTKGGTGDILAGTIVGLLVKNKPLLSAAAAGYLVQKATESLERQVGPFFNSDDLAWEVGRVWKSLIGGV